MHETSEIDERDREIIVMRGKWPARSRNYCDAWKVASAIEEINDV